MIKRCSKRVVSDLALVLFKKEKPFPQFIWPVMTRPWLIIIEVQISSKNYHNKNKRIRKKTKKRKSFHLHQGLNASQTYLQSPKKAKNLPCIILILNPWLHSLKVRTSLQLTTSTFLSNNLLRPQWLKTLLWKITKWINKEQTISQSFLFSNQQRQTQCLEECIKFTFPKLCVSCHDILFTTTLQISLMIFMMQLDIM